MHRSKEVTFKDVLILFLKKFERIFAFALCFAVVFAALGAWKSYRSVSGENLRRTRLVWKIFPLIRKTVFTITWTHIIQ